MKFHPKISTYLGMDMLFSGGLTVFWRVYRKKASCGTRHFASLLVSFSTHGHIREKLLVVPFISSKSLLSKQSFSVYTHFTQVFF